MDDVEKKGADEDGVLIKKRGADYKKDNEIKDKELPIDKLDGGKRGKARSPKKKGESRNPSVIAEEKVFEEKPGKTLKKNLLERLDKKEINALLTARKDLEEKNQIIQEKNNLICEYEDLLKRKQAEFENYRKRIIKESEENKKYANAEIILDIITIMDNFDRAVDSTKSSRDFEGLLEGIIMIEKQFRDMLEKKYGVKKIEAMGKEFDPNCHDAIMMEESEEYQEDTVVEDFQKGYIMHDRIIRPSKVKVAKAVSSVSQLNNNANDKEEEEAPEKG